MRGDVLVIRPAHREAATQIADLLTDRLNSTDACLAIGIAGESGSGKSEIAASLQDALHRRSIVSVILQQDDYFLLPPHKNDANRRADIGWVGPQEVDLERLDRDVHTLLAGALQLEKPLVVYNENRITTETLMTSGCQVVITEGTYVSLLTSLHIRIFIDRDFRMTLEARRTRNRDPLDSFIEQVLRIEHAEIQTHKRLADIVIAEDYSVREVIPES